MMFLPHVMVLFTVFAFTLTIVNLLPSLVLSFQERYQERLLRTSQEMDKFFVHVKVVHILIASAAFGGLVGLMTGSWIIGGVAAAAGTIAPRVILSVWKDMRSSSFDAQLMDALVLMSNALKSGLDIATGIELVTANMTPPISEEFGLVQNAYRLGSPLESALNDMTRRIQSKILETTVSAINIQRETGGNLVKTFDQLILTIREEGKLQKKVRALSAQGRMQIGILAGLPWFLGLFFFFVSPDFMGPALHNPWSQVVLVGMVLWELIGVVFTKHIITVDV